MIIRCGKCGVDMSGDDFDRWISEHKCDCRHHWIIEKCTGPTSKGVCKKCGVTKEFHNHERVRAWTKGEGKK